MSRLLPCQSRGIEHDSLQLQIQPHHRFSAGVLGEGYGAAKVVLLPPDMQERKPGSSGLPHKYVEISTRMPTKGAAA